MNRLAFLLAGLTVLAIAAVATAASPNPPASLYASPLASPGASATASLLPAASTSPAATANANAKPQASAATAQSWNAQIQPVLLSGTATVQRQPDGTGTITLQVSDMVNQRQWVVDVDAGTLDRPDEQVNIAYKTGTDVKAIAPDTITVQLTQQEMDAFSKALQNKGVVVFIHDADRVSAAVFPAS